MSAHPRNRQTIIRQSGFSLLEVLIAIAVTAVGLFGLATVQTMGVNNNHSAYQRSQATVLAYDIADRMRANTVSINNYLTSFMTLAYAKGQGAQSGCISTGGCSTAHMAQHDLFEWEAALSEALPGATGIITVSGSVYTVAVTWDENRDGAVNDSDPGVQVSFQP